MDKDRKNFERFLEELVVSIGGERSLELLNELSEIGFGLLGCLNKQKKFPEEQVDRWNEIVEELYPDKE